MSLDALDSSYTLAEDAAKQSSLQIPSLKLTAEKLALVIPALCEAQNLPGLLDRARAALDPHGICYEIIVVDDDSCDGTAEIVSAIALKDPRVRLLVRQGERGLSGAILFGWRHCDATVLGVMDADLQHPPELLPALISSVLAGHDLVIGSRYAVGGQLGNWNPVRKLLSAAAVWFTLPIQQAGIRAKDPMSGFFLIRRQCVEGILFQPSGFKLLLEVLVRCHIRSVAEIPFAFGLRHCGTSKASFRVGWDYAKLLVRLYIERFIFRWRRV
jgi:dolichol-phosphate mannosyltransferase